MCLFKKEKKGNKRIITILGIKISYNKKKKHQIVSDGKYGFEKSGYLENAVEKKLVMTILARDEIDIIEENIKFHLSQGVDFIIATDNASVDGTRDVFLKYQEQGVLFLIDEPSQDYNQIKWVDRMVRLARDKYQADWVMNIDADEFWYSNLGNLKKDIAKFENHNIAYFSMFNALPEKEEDEKREFYKNTKGYLAFIREYGYEKCMKKSMLKASDYKMIVMGNHDAEMYEKKAINYEGITIFHYTLRSYDQFVHKVIISGEALEKNPSKNQAYHIRRLYQAYLDGNIKEEYNKRLINNDKDPNKDFFVDSRLCDCFMNQNRNICCFERGGKANNNL